MTWKLHTKKNGILVSYSSSNTKTILHPTLYKAAFVLSSDSIDFKNVMEFLYKLSKNTTSYRNLMKQIWKNKYIDSVLISSLKNK